MKTFLGRLSEKYRGSGSSSTALPATDPAPAPEQYVESALAHHRAGHLDEAADIYRKVLAVVPGHFDALHMLGVVHQQKGDSARAVELIEQAISVAPGNCFAQSNLGLAYQAMNRLDKAEAALRRAVALRPDWDDAHNALGTVLRAAGQLDEAEACFSTAVRLNSLNPGALTNLGKISQERGQFDRAMDCFGKARDLQPKDASILVDIGSVHAARAELLEAEGCLRLALQIDGNRFDALCNLGDILRRLDRLAEAESFARKALAIRPDDPDALNTLACVLLRLPALEEAETVCHKALSIRRDDASSQITLGNILNLRNRPVEAEACFRSALRLQPNSSGARYNLSMLKLMEGEYREGLELYESRFDVLQRDFGIAPQIRELLKDHRRWHGEPLFGQRLMIWTEQGFGDSLMMLRYLPMLQARGAGEIVVLCERSLERLVCSISKLSHGVSCAQSVSPDAFDLHCPIMSLPFLFQTTFNAIPDLAPYLTVPNKLGDAWKERLSSITKTKVGLTWSGSKTLRDDAKRSIPLSAFEPLFRFQDVQLISLQKEEGTTQLGAWGGRIVDWMADCDDFMDTAALVQNLDLVISVDTAMVHLAGALGKPVWLLNRYGSEWRWGPESERSPWYPSMRIFRQGDDMSWDGVIAQVAVELSKFQRT